MYKLLKDSLKIRRYLLVTILVIQFISVILSTLLPYMNGMFVDMLIDIKNVEEVIKYAITIAGVGIISLFLSYIYNLKIMKVKNNISFEINSRGILHLQKIPLEIEYEPTYMTQRLNSDSRIVVDFFFDKIITATINLFVMFFLISLLFYLSKPIFWVTGVFILIYIFIYLLLKGEIYERNYKFKENQSDFFNTLNEQLVLREEIKVHSIFNIFGKVLNSSYKSFFGHAYKAYQVGLLFQTLDQIVCVCFQAITLILGGALVLKGQLSIGQYTIINIYFLNLLTLIKYFFGLGKEYQDVKSSIDRINEIFSIPLENNGTVCLEKIKEIDIKNFCIRNLFCFNEKLEVNNMYVVTGENGIGKTTFLKGMLGLFNEYTGNVYYSDENLRKIDKFYLRKNNISVMLQNEKVPYMNVEEYLCKFLDKNSLKKIKDEIIQIGGGELLNKIHLEELRKKNLQQISDGERQIVLCLRTILKKADIYLLDEPTTNLSIEIANLFLDFLLEIKKKKIVLIISHDEMVINKADMKIKISKNLVEKVKTMKT